MSKFTSNAEALYKEMRKENVTINKAPSSKDLQPLKNIKREEYLQPDVSYLNTIEGEYCNNTNS